MAEEMKHTPNDVPLRVPINFEAWARNAVAFIRERGLEGEFKDWCGGFPCPLGVSEDDTVETVARALHALDCHEADEDCRRAGREPPEKWADPWLPTGIRQLEALRRRARVFLAAITASGEG